MSKVFVTVYRLYCITSLYTLIIHVYLYNEQEEIGWQFLNLSDAVVFNIRNKLEEVITQYLLRVSIIEEIVVLLK